MRLHISRYQLKLFLLCLLLGVIPVLVLGVFSYFKFSSSIQGKVQEGKDLLLQQTQSQIESTLKMIDLSVFQIGSSELVTEALKTDIASGDFPLVNNLQRAMQRIQIYDLGINNIQLINLKYNWMIDNNGYSELGQLPDKKPLPLTVDLHAPSEWMTIPTKDSDTGPAVNQLYLIKTLPILTKDPEGFIVTRMSKSQLFRFLPKTSKLGTIVVLDAGQRVIGVSDGSDIGQAVTSLPEVQRVLQAGANKGYTVIRSGGSEYGVTYHKSAYNGWDYLSIISIDDMMKESHEIGWLTVWICAIITALILLLSLQGASKMYSPVRRLYSATMQTDIEDPGADSTPKDEFQVIENRIQNMYLDRRQMSGHIDRLHQQLKPFVILKLVKDELAPHEIKEQLGAFGYSTDRIWLAVVIVRIGTLAGTRFEERDRDLLLFAVSNMVEELIPPHKRLSPVVIEQLQVTVFYGSQPSKEEFKAYLLNTVKGIRQKVMEVIGLSINVGISRPYEAYEATPRAYQEGLNALKYRITKEDQDILFIEDVEPQTHMAAFPDHLEKQLAEAVKLADENRARALLKEFMHIISNRELTWNQMQNWLMKLLLDLIYIPEQLEIADAVKVDGTVPLYEQLSLPRTVQEIEDWFWLRIIEPILSAVDQSKENQYQKLSREVVQIIESEYDRDLTLEECASRLHYHPSYIRRVLKKSLDTNFTEYLLNYRMDIAKRWLLETEMKISDIALKLQYNNPQNFIRYFKKITGTTPGQYREINLQSAAGNGGEAPE